MGLDFFRRTLELEEELRRPGQRILNTIQTNGTLLDDEWGAFLHDHDFLVGLSIDGPREMHDAYRVDKGGKPTFDRVVRGLDVLRRHAVEWNALTTVNAANGDHGREVYAFLRDDLGARFIQLIPVVERVTSELLHTTASGWGNRGSERPLYRQQGDLVTHRTVGAGQYGQFLVEVFEDWARHDVGDVFVQVFDTALAHWLGMDQVGMCVHARTCGQALALEHNGDLYSCDHFVEPDHLIGNIGQTHMVELLASPKQRRFGTDKRDRLPQQCRDCPVRFACNGECPKNRFTRTSQGEPGLNYLCAGYFAFFTHIDGLMRIMADLLRAGRFADEVMNVLSSASRNDPCPCGSGRKTKACHGGNR
jgi:uncharacterized protein